MDSNSTQTSPQMGLKLRTRRKELKKTIPVVAAESGCDVGSISRWERMVEKPRVTALIGLSAAYEISVEQLVEWLTEC